MPEPIIAVGLGNPGFEYQETRHNVGFMVVDAVAARLKAGWKRGNGEYVLCQSAVGDRVLVLVKPLTYMNNCGEAVLDVLEQFSVPIRDLIVVVDDFAFTLGTIRVREKGTDGGHNGLRSIIYHLQTHEFVRLRCGIKREMMPPKREMAQFVLSPFEDDEQDGMRRMIENAADAVMEFAASGVAKTMNKFNA